METILVKFGPFFGNCYLNLPPSRIIRELLKPFKGEDQIANARAQWKPFRSCFHPYIQAWHGQATQSG